MPDEVAPKVAVKRPRKLGKDIQGTVVVITEGVTGSVLKYDFNVLPKDIQGKFGPFGLGHKLGDAAAGKEGKDAVEAINKVWEGLMANDWSVRAPAGEKVSKSAILENFEKLSDKEKAVAKPLLVKLGLLKE